MKRQKGQKFSQKHGNQTAVDPSIKEKMVAHAKGSELPCAVAFKLSEELNQPPAEIGKTADLLEFELVKCQLGLFGYKPEKKIVTPKLPVDPRLEDAIRKALIDGNLPCKHAWDIALNLSVSKMTVSAACEALNVKIKPCQLGAF
jgi:hypothetical protein